MNYRYSFDGMPAEALTIMLVVILIALAVLILFLLNLHQTLSEVSEHNRQIQPGRAWLLLIPLFSIGYAFYFLPKLSESLRLEFLERENPQTGDYGIGIGRGYAIMGALGLVNRVLGPLGSLISIAGLVLMIVLWVKMAQYKNILRKSRRGDTGFTNRTDILD